MPIQKKSTGPSPLIRKIAEKENWESKNPGRVSIN